ncbi:TonB-dependent receptor [candidate division WOR-3 bacterium]|nr:TonB-dependent receptor [candidate division WOR-3 bacterium]
MEPLIVTASKIPTTLLGTNRDVIVIEKGEIESSPASGIADLLKYISGVEISERGPQGIQSDVSVGGGTFEQSLILIDGIKMNDPQTAHHNLNIPVQLEDIERIEILKGPGVRLYGAGAFTGVINIITKKGETKNLEIKAMGGDYKLLEGNLSLSQPLGVFNNYFSVSGKRSDGYRYNTDFNLWNVFFKSSIDYGKLNGDISLGYNDKEFGANCFYSDNNPNEREHTKTAFAKGSIDFEKNNISVYWRRHKDNDILDFEDPSYYTGDHTTHTYGLALKSTIYSRAGITTAGLEGEGEKIRSTSIGSYSRTKSLFFFEHKLPTMKNITIIFGSSLFYYSDWDWYFYPGVDIGFRFNSQTHLYASIERAFRVPSYTELYLDSPANIGNPDLTPERASSFETGIKMIRGSILTNINAFLRKEKNIIDWVRETSSEPWRAENAGDVTVKGLDVNINYKPIVRMYKKFPVPSVDLGYTFLNLQREESSLQSKYLLKQPEHKFTLSADYELSSSLKQIWKARYEILPDSERRLILDTKISLEIKNSEFFIDITNLLNTEYTQAQWIPMPGRWAKAGIRVEIY